FEYFSQFCILAHDSSMGFGLCFVFFYLNEEFKNVDVCMYVWCIHASVYACFNSVCGSPELMPGDFLNRFPLILFSKGFL
ncbi:hypothetical protein ACQP3L_34855, partial [Escherichia coli]